MDDQPDSTRNQLLSYRLGSTLADRHLPAKLSKQWHDFTFTRKVNCHVNKVFFIWTYLLGKPSVLHTLRTKALNMDATQGFSIYATVDNEQVYVNHCPKQLVEGIFIRIPNSLLVSYFPTSKDPDEKRMTVRFPLEFKTKANPMSLLEGETYVSTVTEFRRLFPSHPIKY